MIRGQTGGQGRRQGVSGAAVLVASLALAGCSFAQGSPAAVRERTATIAYVVDGDTLRVELNGALQYVRLVGIDTPEDVRPGYPVECGAKRAAASMTALAPRGAKVMLREDRVAGERDSYGRLLAHVYIAGRQVEVAQLRRGWADVYRYDEQRFEGLPRFRRAEGEARTARRGYGSSAGETFTRARNES